MSTVTLPHYLDYYLPDNEESISEEEFFEFQSYPCQYDTKRGLTVLPIVLFKESLLQIRREGDDTNKIF